jgi:hypothetical protein
MKSTVHENSIIHVLNLVRAKPGLYLGTPSLECLAAFINGWFLAVGDRVTDGKMFEGFLAYLEKKWETSHRLHENVSWIKAIQLHSFNTFEAHNLFFRLLDEFLAGNETGQVGPTTASPSSL